jgi:hypothetical protein
MSRVMDFAKAVQERLEAVAALAPEHQDAQPVLDGLPIIIDRQKDLLAEIEMEISKATGTCIVLYPTRGSRNRRARRGDPFGCDIIAEVYATPIMKPNAPPADDVMEAIVLALDGWPRPGGHTGHADDMVAVETFELVPDRDFLVWRITANARQIIK